MREALTARGDEQRKLHQRAADIRDKTVSRAVYFRGLIEFSNKCINDCLYCGIRKSNNAVKRYMMDKEEILDAVEFCERAGYGSVVLQSGEQKNKKFTGLISSIVGDIKKKFPKISITLCVGEQEKSVYQEFFDSGAERYLLRIETSNAEHYKKLHPKEMSFSERYRCLNDLKNIGFQVGTGVMVNAPSQTLDMLAEDILFFREIDADMIGMGPYIPHSKTPLYITIINKTESLNLTLNMIALTRIMMPDVNIAATTALQALHPKGRELGLLSGANVIMPLVTPIHYRNNYVLYDDKPCRNESSLQCANCVTERIYAIDLVPKHRVTGDSLHYINRITSHHVNEGKGVDNDS